jgi:TetR/AcrR family transcriptional repressor of nem operon
MRYEREHKTQTRDRIVRNTARKLRAEGLKGPGVASVMKASGLTVGEKVYSSLQDVPREDRWKEVVRRYLSPEHCDHPETGCPVAALAPEIARAKLTVRKQISSLMKERAERWVEFMPGATAPERERNFFVIFSAMAGAVSIARLLTEPAEREKVLVSVRDHLLHSF